jgi:hypothetical protein
MKKSNYFPVTSFSVKPINSPEIINTHLVRINGKWVEKPGAIAAIISVTAKENVDENIENCFTEIWKNSKVVSKPNLQTKIRDCQHKLYAVRFHLQAIAGEIVKQYNDFQKNYKAGSGVSFEQINPILIYETESFLFQVKSSLD